MTPFRCHFQRAGTGERLSQIVPAETPAEAKAAVSKAYEGETLIWLKVKIDRSGGEA